MTVQLILLAALVKDPLDAPPNLTELSDQLSEQVAIVVSTKPDLAQRLVNIIALRAEPGHALSDEMMRSTIAALVTHYAGAVPSGATVLTPAEAIDAVTTGDHPEAAEGSVELDANMAEGLRTCVAAVRLPNGYLAFTRIDGDKTEADE